MPHRRHGKAVKLVKQTKKRLFLFISLLAVTVAAADTVRLRPIRELYNFHQRAFFLDTPTATSLSVTGSDY